jgi:glycosyltransferase involved in cell wall biosynthesis
MHVQAPTHGEPHKAMKVLFILPNVAVGGVERVRLTLMQQFVADGIECLLALRRCRGELIERALKVVPVYELAPHGIHQYIPELVRLLKREQPTHVVTAFSDVAVLAWVAMQLARSRARWVHSVHNTHSMAGARQGFWGRLRYRSENHMAGFAYRRADAIVTVSEGVRQEILERYLVDSSRVTTIYNPAVPDDQLKWVRPALPGDARICRIVTIGRLVHQKGFDILIRAMARTNGAWQLDIWGEGPERPNLETVIRENELQGRIVLRGYTPDPYAVLRDADLFVMSSRHEGLPATLIEALACQCQIVATDCPHGPREILKDGKLGQLIPVEDEGALSDAVTRAIDGISYVGPGLLRDRAGDFQRSVCCLRWESVLRSPDA